MGPARRWAILEVLDWTRLYFEQQGIPTPRLDAEVLISQALGLPRVMLYARFDLPLESEELARIRTMVSRRARGEPVAYIVGQREFWSMTFDVTPEVLIPRPETETLVEIALHLLKGNTAPRVADVGTGSGCVACAIAQEIPGARVIALEISPGACAVARKNVASLRLVDRVSVQESDLLSALSQDDEALDLIVANLPYVPEDLLPTLMREVRDFEPRTALSGGRDGLTHIERLISSAPQFLVPGGAIALEAGPNQVDEVDRLLAKSGFVDSALPTATGEEPRHVAHARRGERA